MIGERMSIKVYDPINTPWDSLTTYLTQKAYLAKFHKGERISDESLATLILADSVKDRPLFDDMFGHQICMGLRMGLFGSDAANWSSILSLKNDND
jgi:hypothetical protein